MTILTIITAPDSRLKQKAPALKAVSDEDRQQLDDLLETMYDAKGIGLAATQVGIMKRMLVLDVEQGEDDTPGHPMKLINPEITWESEELNTYKEGCLSFPTHYADVDRPAEIKVRYLDEKGTAHELHARGLLATCIQHEIDHLDGVTFVDHISRLKREMIIKKLTKLKKEGGEIPRRTRSPYAEVQSSGDTPL